METTMSSAIIDDLAARGLIHTSTDLDELRARLEQGPITLYCGFDPTSDSLHIGSLVPLLLLRRFQDFGHRSILLAGGATGMVGDPSGRSDERNLLDGPTLDANVEAIKAQLSAFLSFEDGDGTNAALLVNNRDWTEPVGVLDFLRDVGKHVTVNTMLAKESIKNRVESDQGISFTEFSYMLLQANDFYELNTSHGCEMQVGGSDQWGNITAGIDLIRRRSAVPAYGLVIPLVTKADGTKFGKTADGAVWLDPARTLPYEFHQYFLRTDDADVEGLLWRLTMLPVPEIADVMSKHLEAPQERVAQKRLADAVTTLVHGETAVERANLAAGVLFGGVAPTGEALDAVRGVIAETSMAATLLDDQDAMTNALVESGLASSRGDARRTLEQNGVSVNGVKQGTLARTDVLDGGYVLLQKGKKSRHLLVVA
jgi:tyrosyl-tRNA synthetase